MRVIFALLLAVCLACPAFAASRSEPALRVPVLAANYPWQEGLSLTFAVDEDACRKKYGSRWQQKCAAAPGMPGQPAQGIALSPSARGSWQWRDGQTCVFMPEDGSSLAPDTSYEADLSAFRLPGHISLSSRKTVTRTLPKAAMLTDSHFWIDPAPEARHRLGMTFVFTYPVKPGAFEPVLTLPQGASAGIPELVWNSDRDRLSVSWPIDRLPRSEAAARASLPGCSQFSIRDGNLTLSGSPYFAQLLPARDGLFAIRAASIRPENNDRLDQRHILEIETSLQATAAELQKRLLVIELPEFRSRESAMPCNWAELGRAPAEAIREGRELKPVSLQPGADRRSKFRFELPVRPGRYALVAIAEGMPSAGGQKLRETWADIIQAAPFSSRVGFLQPGHIARPDSRLDLHASDLDGIAWQIQRVRTPFLALLAQTSWDSFTDPLALSSLSMDSLSESISGSLPLASQGPGQAAFASVAPGEQLKKAGQPASGLVLVSLEGLKNGEKAATASRLILLSDLHLLVKAGTGLDCFASFAGQPAKGATIRILGANGSPVAEAVTDAQGHVRFGNLAGLGREHKPVCAVAEYQDNLAWLPLADKKRRIDWQDTAGAHVASDGVIACVFSEAGIYRPGDRVHFGILPRRGNFSLLPGDLHLFGEVVDPAGRIIAEQDFVAGEYGFAETDWQSLPESLSGNYTFNVRPGRKGPVLGSLRFRLEQFQPDTLKLGVMPPDFKGWLRPEAGKPVMASLELRNLYGDPASGHKLRGRALTSPAIFRFPGYEDFVFTDPAPFLGSGQERRLPETSTDANGGAVLTVPDDLLGSSSIMTLAAEGFDLAGGRAVSGSAAFLVSPAEAILGYRLSGNLTNPEFISQNSRAIVDLLALNPDLAPVALRGLDFAVYRLHNATSLISDGSGGYRYAETPHEQLVKNWKADLPAKPVSCELPTDEPGSHALLIRDGKGRLLARIPYTVAGEKILSGDAELKSSKMRMSLDRKSYKSGDELTVSFALPYAASGVLALERDAVEAFVWVEGHAGDNIAKIRLPEGFEGRGYATLVLARHPESGPIYLSPLASAVVPFTAGMEARDPGLELLVPDQAEPGQTLEISLRAAKPGKAIVFAVDRGILQLAPWRSPDPLAVLLGERGLDVATVQMSDLLMPDHAQISRRLSAFGGGTDASPFGARFQNPFRRKNEPPLVFWSGLIDIGPDSRQVRIPTASWHSGGLAVFAVMAGADAAGAVEKSCSLKAPLVLTPGLPLHLAPGDEFLGSLAVANTTDVQQEVALSLIVPKSLRLLEALPEKLVIPAKSERLARFSCLALDEPGEAELGFEAEAAGRKFRRSLSFSLRPAAGFRQTFQTGKITASADLPVTRAVYASNAKSQASIAAVPLPLAQGLGRYLELYPYGCTEQLVSRAFAMILLKEWHPENGQKLLDAARDAIASRSDGQLVALWPGGDGDLLLTAYVVDYLLTMRDMGFGCPEGLLRSLCDGLYWNSGLNAPDLASARASAYALWVLGREGRIITQRLEELLRALDEKDVPGWREDLTAALLAACKKEMAMPASIDPAAIVISPSGWFDEYAQASLLATLAARYFPGELSDSDKSDFFERSAAALNQGGFSTFSACQGIRALTAISGPPARLQARISCVEPEQAGEMQEQGGIYSVNLEQCEKYRVDLPDGSGQAFWQIATAGYDREPVSKSANGIEISREYLDVDGNSVTELAQGDELTVRLTLRPLAANVGDCVITDLLPGCLELIMPKDADLTAGVRFIDRQEDRLLAFVEPGDSQFVLTYRCRAVHPGSFVAPAPVVEAMYDQSVTGSGEQGRLVVRQAK